MGGRASRRGAALKDDLAIFTNRLRMLRSIDRHELVQARVMPVDDEATWTWFRRNPYDYMIRASDQARAAVWTIIQRQEAT